jgi:hypothetical protein
VCVLILYTGSDNLDSWYLSFWPTPAKNPVKPAVVWAGST